MTSRLTSQRAQHPSTSSFSTITRSFSLRNRTVSVLEPQTRPKQQQSSDRTSSDCLCVKIKSKLKVSMTMFGKSLRAKDRASKATKPSKSKRSFHSDVKKMNMNMAVQHVAAPSSMPIPAAFDSPSPVSHAPSPSSPIITMVIGDEKRVFASHEEVLRRSPYLDSVISDTSCHDMYDRVLLPDQSPEIMSAVMEFLYKGDYSPRLQYDPDLSIWTLEESDHASSTVWLKDAGGPVLKDSIMYVQADALGLPDLKRLALRKSALRTSVSADTVLRTARYVYAHCADEDYKLRAHFLSLIIRGRKTYKNSGVLQQEFFRGGSHLFFDLYVALANHLDDVLSTSAAASPSINTNAYGIRSPCTV